MACFPHFIVLNAARDADKFHALRERERERERVNFYYTGIEVKAQMTVEQPVPDTNYKHFRKKKKQPTMRIMIITIAIITTKRKKIR